MGFWIPLAMSALGAVTGAKKAEEDKKLHAIYQKGEAEATRYSPWTGIKGKTAPMKGSQGAIMQGLMAGLMMGQQFTGEGKGGPLTGTHTSGKNLLTQAEEDKMFADDFAAEQVPQNTIAMR